MLSLSLVLTLLTACTSETETQEIVVDAQPTDTVEESKSSKQQEIKLSYGVGNVVEAYEKLQKSKMSEKSKAELAFYIAGSTAFSNVDAVFLEDAVLMTWANLQAGKIQEAYSSASGISDTALSAGLKAIAVGKGATSTLQEQWNTEQTQLSKKKNKGEEPHTPKVWTSEESLELLMFLDDAAAHLESASTVSSWSAQMALALWAQKKGDSEGELKYWTAMNAVEGAHQLYAQGQLARMSQDIAKIKEVLATTSTNGDMLSGRLALDALVDLHSSKGTFQQLWDDAKESLQVEKNTKEKELGWEAVSFLRLSTLVGESRKGLKIAPKLLEKSTGKILDEVSWYTGLLAVQTGQLGLAKTLQEKSATQENAAQKNWAAIVDAVLKQSQVEISVKLLDGLTVEQQVQLVETLCPISQKCMETLLPKVQGEKLWGVQKLSLAFLQDDFARFQGKDNRKALNALGAEFEGKSKVQLEINLRKSFYGDSASWSASEDSSEMEKLWVGVFTSQFLKTESKEKPLMALSNWSAFEASRVMDKSLQGLMGGVVQNAPLHRIGLLSIGTSLDFSNGVSVLPAIQSLVGKTNDTVATSGVGLLEFHRVVQMNQSKALNGYLPFTGLSEEDAFELLSQTQKLRIQFKEYWMGGTFPTEGLSKLYETEKSFMDLMKPIHLYHKNPVDGNQMREKFRRTTSVLSVISINDTLYGAVLAPTSSGVYQLGSYQEFVKAAQKHDAELLKGQDKHRINHLPGNAYREMLLSPVWEEVKEARNFVVLLPAKLNQFALGTLPEQKDGLRYLADIRNISYATTMETMWNSLEEAGSYDLNMFGVARTLPQESFVSSITDASKNSLLQQQKSAPDIELLNFLFSESSKVLIGAEGTVASFIENAPKARYIYLSEIPMSTNGGFKMADGELSLSQIENLSLKAMVVFLSPSADPVLQSARVEALMNAGARSVLVQDTAIPTADLQALTEEMLMALRRNDGIMVSVTKSRQKYVQEMLEKQKGFQNSDPMSNVNNAGIWGAWSVYGLP